ncbi:MAG TPA: hypothetical protein VNS46_12295 [Nocardioides sp.]|nr:hypothetical protein [Nocardioides sp.]
MRRTLRPRQANPRGRQRLGLMVAGALPALLVLGYLVKVGLMLQHNAAGRDAFDRGEYDSAASEFFDTRDLNLFEPWVAPFDEGAAHHAEGAFDDAIAAYDAALEDVPERDECTVRINLALAHEAVGDQRQADQDLDGAIEAWQEGIDVLAAGECPTDSGRGQKQSDDAAAVDERLQRKLQEAQEQQEQEQEPQPGQPRQPPGEQPDDGEGEDPRQERLERNNQQGREQRSDEQDLYDGEDYTRPETW